MSNARGGGSETGASTVAGVSLVAVIMLFLIAATILVSAAIAASRASTAADLAALAAADAYRGITRGEPCEKAATVVAGNGARLVNCRLEAGQTVRVETAVTVPSVVSWLLPEATGKARAGPPP